MTVRASRVGCVRGAYTYLPRTFALPLTPRGLVVRRQTNRLFRSRCSPAAGRHDAPGGRADHGRAPAQLCLPGWRVVPPRPRGGGRLSRRDGMSSRAHRAISWPRLQLKTPAISFKMSSPKPAAGRWFRVAPSRCARRACCSHPVRHGDAGRAARHRVLQPAHMRIQAAVLVRWRDQ